EPQQHLELIVAVLELRYFLAAHERPQAVGERVDVDAEIGGARAVDIDPKLRLRRLEIRVDIDDARYRAHLVHQLDGVLLQLLDARSVDQNVQTVEAAAPAARAAAAGTAAAAPGRSARDVGAARHADARALILPQHLARADHELLLRHFSLFERHHD